MSRILGIAILLLVTACNQKQEQDVIDIEDLIPESELYSDSKEEEIVETDTLIVWKHELEKSGIACKDIARHDIRNFPDRFGAINSLKLALINERDTIYYSSWVYKDSSLTMNAFYNWLDCFSPSCKSYYVFDKKRMLPGGFELYVSDTTLIVIEDKRNSIDKNWEAYLLKKGYEGNWNFVLRQTMNGVVRWYQFDYNAQKIIQK